jgi:hypothetical protein
MSAPAKSNRPATYDDDIANISPNHFNMRIIQNLLVARQQFALEKSAGCDKNPIHWVLMKWRGERICFFDNRQVDRYDFPSISSDMMAKP